MKYLLKAVDTYRVESLDEVDRLHHELLDDGRFELIAFTYKHKTTKDDDYFVAAATKVFADEKMPEAQFDVNYEEM